MLAVALGVTLLVEDPSGAKEQDGPEGLPRKQPTDGTDRRQKGSRRFDHVVDGPIGPVVLAVKAVFPVQDHLLWLGGVVAGRLQEKWLPWAGLHP